MSAAEGLLDPAAQENAEQASVSVCQVCQQQPHKYRCPGCQVQTCSLACSKQHKQQTGCAGKRDKLAFVPMQQFTDRHLLSDYRWLEEVSRADDNARRHRPPVPRRELPQHLSGLVHQAKLRGVRLLIMPPGMQRRQSNSTRFDFKARKLLWRIEWRFPAAAAAAAAAAPSSSQAETVQGDLAAPQGQQISGATADRQPAAAAAAAASAIVPAAVPRCVLYDGRVDEESVLADVLSHHLNYQPGSGGQALLLRQYRQAGGEALTVLMRKERCPANAVRYYRMDLQQSLKSQLAGKTVIEYPTLIVLLPGEETTYSILSAEEQQAEQQAGFRHSMHGGFRYGAPGQNGGVKHLPPPPPPPPPRQPSDQPQQQGPCCLQQQHQQQEGAVDGERPAKRPCIVAEGDPAADSCGIEHLGSLEESAQQQQQQHEEQQQQEQQQYSAEEHHHHHHHQQQQQPKYYYYDPADGADEDAADLLAGLEDEKSDETTAAAAAAAAAGSSKRDAQMVAAGLVTGGDEGRAAMMQLLGQYDENEIELDVC